MRDNGIATAGERGATDGGPESRPLRVCFLTYPPERYSGAVFHAFWLAERLAALGTEIEFLSVVPDERPSREVVRGFTTHYLRRGPRWLGKYPEAAVWPRLLRFFRRGRFDVLHMHMCHYLEAFAAVAARRAGTASLANIMQQGSDLADTGRVETALRRRFLRSFDRIVPISDETWVECLAAGVAPDRLTKIPISVDVERFRPATVEERRALRARHGLPADGAIVSYVGAFSARKNVVWLIDAWLASPAAASGSRLLVVGDVANDPEGMQVRRQVEARLALADGRIHWIPFVREIEEIYRLSDAFVLPSLREGMPTVVLQAMASGLPVLATPVSGVPEIMGERGARGRIFDFGDDHAFQAALADIMNDPAAAGALGHAAREHMVRHYSLDRVAGDYLLLYNSVRRSR